MLYTESLFSWTIFSKIWDGAWHATKNFQTAEYNGGGKQINRETAWIFQLYTSCTGSHAVNSVAAKTTTSQVCIFHHWQYNMDPFSEKHILRKWYLFINSFSPYAPRYLLYPRLNIKYSSHIRYCLILHEIFFETAKSLYQYYPSSYF